MVDTELVLGIIFLIILISVFWAIKNVTAGKNRKVYAIGLEGTQNVKRIAELNVIKDGNFLVDAINNHKMPITTSPVNFHTLKGKKDIMGYVVDMDKGTTVDIEKSSGLIELKTDPELISNVVDSRLIQDAFALKPSRGVIIVVALVGLAAGLIIGKSF